MTDCTPTPSARRGQTTGICGISAPPAGAPAPVFWHDGQPAWLYPLHDPRLATPLRKEARPSRACSSLCVTLGAMKSFPDA